MTMKTGSAYDVLFNDRKYKDLLDKRINFRRNVHYVPTWL